MGTRDPDVPIPGDDPFEYLDKQGLRRERERLGAGPLGVALLLLLVGGIPLMYGVHASRFAHSTEATVLATYASLDDLPPVLFDPVTQEPEVRYCGDPEGDVEFVGKHAEFSPTTGERCWPLTREVLRTLREAESRRREEAEGARMAQEVAKARATEEEARAIAERRKAEEAEESRKVEEEARAAVERRRQLEREQAIRAERAFRERYVNSSAVPQLRGGHVTVAVSDNRLERSIAQALRDRAISVSTNVFTDEIFDGRVFPRLVAGDRELFHRLQLGDGRATLLLGEMDLEPVTRTGVGNAINIRGRLAVHVVRLSGDSPLSLPTLTEVGVGFNEEQARIALEERLLEVLLVRPEIQALSQ